MDLPPVAQRHSIQKVQPPLGAHEVFFGDTT